MKKKKITAKKKKYFLIKKIAIYLSLGLHKGCLSCRRKKPSALKIEHAELQNMEFLNFFSIFVGHFCFPGSGSDPDFESGYGSTDLIGSGSNPDPKHWKNFYTSVALCLCSASYSSLLPDPLSESQINADPDAYLCFAIKLKAQFYICSLSSSTVGNCLRTCLGCYRYENHCFGSGPGPYSIRSVDPDSESGSGSGARRAKVIHRNRKKLRNFFNFMF
jgi:hypothetical protein